MLYFFINESIFFLKISISETLLIFFLILLSLKYAFEKWGYNNSINSKIFYSNFLIRNDPSQTS